ncbi:MAG: LysR family transcriptional regulator [Candidatus Glassbacteria bacterium]|nr:LysR family transcriptional regulator [Candidatus Glassbacteria bacterium]
MLLEHLRFFYAVAENGSFTRAARDLLLTQPAVSSQIRNLEERLGQRLFERQGKNIQLTEAGKILYSQSRKIFQQLREVEVVLNDLKSLETGRLNLGTVDVISIYVLPMIFREFHQRYPRVEISIEVDNSFNLCSGVAGGELDLGFVTLPVEDKSLVSVPIYNDVMRVIANSRHPLAGRKLVTLEDLSKTNLIIYKRGSVTRRILEQIFESHGFELSPDMEIDRPEAMKKLVEVGLGVSIIPEMTIKREVEEGSLVVLEMGNIRFERQLGLVYRKGQFFSPSTAAFIEVLQGKLKFEKQAGNAEF